MSRSWNREIHVRLLAHGATLEWRQRWPQRVLAREELAFAQPDLAPAVATVAARLDARGWSGPVQVVLGNRWLRFASLPWPLQSGNDETDRLTAAGWLAQADASAAAPASAGAWQVHWDAARFGQDRLFVAASTDISGALVLLDSAAHPLRQWRPWAMEAWNNCRHLLPAGSGTLYVPEAGSLALIHYEEGRATRLQLRAYPTHDCDSLVSLLRLEELRQAQPLLICAAALPAAWQAVLSAVGTLLPGAQAPSPAGSEGRRQRARGHALALVAQPSTPPSRRWLSLLLMATLAGIALLQVREIAALERQREEQLGRQEELAFLLERQEAHATSTLERPGSAALASIRQQLTIPWHNLFNALDQAASPAVSLLTFSPDAANRQLRLTIEAATLDGALDYVSRLSRQPELVDAHLVSQRPAIPLAPTPTLHLPNQGSADKARYEVVARWRQP